MPEAEEVVEPDSVTNPPEFAEGDPGAAGPPPPPVEPAEAPQQETAPVVIILKETDPATGNISTKVLPQGDVRPTEVETLIKLGLQAWQRQIGV